MILGWDAGWEPSNSFWLRPSCPKRDQSHCGNAGFSITSCGTTKATGKNGIMSGTNPVRAGLVAKAEDWPYAGEIIPIERI